jgi:hypothetical protein
MTTRQQPQGTRQPQGQPQRPQARGQQQPQAPQAQKPKKPKTKNGISFADKQVTTHLFRITFTSLTEMTAYMGNAPSFNFTMLFPHDVDFSKPVSNKPRKDGKPPVSMDDAIYNAKVELWGADENNWPEYVRDPIEDGDTRPTWEGFPGNYCVKAKSYYAIKTFGTMRDPNTNKFMTIPASEIEDGDYCRATLTANAYDEMGKNNPAGVNFYCSAIQLVKKGERFVSIGNSDSFDDGVYEDEFQSPEIEDDSQPEPDNTIQFRQGASRHPGPNSRSTSRPQRRSENDNDDWMK